MTILLFGHDGYIGSEFFRKLKNKGFEVLTAKSRNSNGKQHSFDFINCLIRSINCDVVINCSGYTGKPNVDACELHKDEVISSNVIFVKMLGDICENHKITLGHISSGCIYNGYVDGGYKETDIPNFTFKTDDCSFYSGTKALAEDVLYNVEKKYIWRLRIPFDNNNDVRNYLKKLMTYDTLVITKNSISNKNEFVDACIDCLIKKVPYGIYNITNDGYVDTIQVVELIKKKLKLNKEFKYFNSYEDFSKIIKTPRSNCVLNVDKLKGVGIHMKPIMESLEWSLNNWNDLSTNVTN